MQTIVTDVCAVCLSVGFTVWGLFGAAFAKSLWPLVIILLVGGPVSCQEHRQHKMSHNTVETRASLLIFLLIADQQ